MSGIRYKVLWVDDLSGTQDEIFATGFESVADEKGIDLIPFTNWEEELELERTSNPILLLFLMQIANMEKMIKTDEFFIPSVIASLARMFGEKRQVKPWYILSAGTMSKFDDVIQIAQRDHAAHQRNGEIWFT